MNKKLFFIPFITSTIIFLSFSAELSDISKKSLQELLIEKTVGKITASWAADVIKIYLQNSASDIDSARKAFDAIKDFFKSTEQENLSDHPDAEIYIIERGHVKTIDAIMKTLAKKWGIKTIGIIENNEHRRIEVE